MFIVKALGVSKLEEYYTKNNQLVTLDDGIYAYCLYGVIQENNHITLQFVDPHVNYASSLGTCFYEITSNKEGQ